MSGMEIIPLAIAGAQALASLMQGMGEVAIAKQDQYAARGNAEVARQEGMEQYRIEERKARKTIGAAEVAAGSNGIRFEGSALDVIGEIAANGEYRASTALYEGRRRYEAYKAEERAAKKRKNAAVIKTGVSIGTTLLTAWAGGAGGGMAGGAMSSATSGAAASGAGSSFSGVAASAAGGL